MCSMNYAFINMAFTSLAIMGWNQRKVCATDDIERKVVFQVHRLESQSFLGDDLNLNFCTNIRIQGQSLYDIFEMYLNYIGYI